MTELFMLPSDEEAVVEAMRIRLPDAALVDDSPWESVNKPPVREQISACGQIVGIWNRRARPRLVGRTRADGRIDLPDNDHVVLWHRSLERTPGLLSHGRWATSLLVSDVPEVFEFVSALWKVLSAITTNRLRRVSAKDPNTPERRFRVGAHAFREAGNGRLRLMADGLQLAPEVGYVWPAH